MEFKDWAPIIVAFVSLVGVVVVPALTGNRPKQQLEALKAVREGIASSDDEQVKDSLREAERGLADRLKARYSTSSVALRRRRAILFLIASVAALGVLGYVFSASFIGTDAPLTTVSLALLACAAVALYGFAVVPALWGYSNTVYKQLIRLLDQRADRRAAERGDDAAQR